VIKQLQLELIASYHCVQDSKSLAQSGNESYFPEVASYNQRLALDNEPGSVFRFLQARRETR